MTNKVNYKEMEHPATAERKGENTGLMEPQDDGSELPNIEGGKGEWETEHDSENEREGSAGTEWGTGCQEENNPCSLAHARNPKDPRFQGLKRWMQTVIMELRAMPHVNLACRKANISTATAYEYRELNLQFRELWDEAVESHVDTAEYSLYDLGTKGDTRRTYKNGELVAEETRRDSQALRFYLAGNRPQKYRENTQSQLTVNILNWSNGSMDLPQPVEHKADTIELGDGDVELLGE